jgi:hypothetical protein
MGIATPEKTTANGGQHPSDQALWEHDALLPGPGILHSQDPFGEVDLNHWSLDEIQKFRHEVNLLAMRQLWQVFLGTPDLRAPELRRIYWHEARWV